MKKRNRIVVLLLVGGILIAWAPILVHQSFEPWSEICCSRQEINIKTGQARYSRYLYFRKISERIEDTPLSDILGGTVVDVAQVEPWRTVNVFSPRCSRHSPHYTFHGAFHQVHEIEMMRDFYGLSPMETEDIARQLMVEWQTNGNYFAAGDYLNHKMMELEESRTKK